jgi:hypothetical protein
MGLVFESTRQTASEGLPDPCGVSKIDGMTQERVDENIEGKRIGVGDAPLALLRRHCWLHRGLDLLEDSMTGCRNGLGGTSSACTSCG